MIHSSLRTAQTVLSCILVGGLTACGGSDSPTVSAATKNSYSQQTFVANDAAEYQPSLGTEPAFIDAWGIAIRPAGIPGHFWVLAGDKSYEYVGDVTGKKVSPCTAASALCADLAPLPTNTVAFPDFPVVAQLDGNGQPLLDGSGNPIPFNDANGHPIPDINGNHGTGVAFNSVATSFVITQTPTTGAPITAGAKFLFATNYGAIYAWTERNKGDGTYDRAATAVKVFDARVTGDGGQFYGLAISPTSDKLYIADFGLSFSIRVFDKTFNEITSTLNGFKNPFAADPAHIKAGDYVPWNVQVLNGSVFVAYAKVQQDPAGTPGAPFPANEVHAAGAGRLAEFDLNGKLISVWDDGGLLNSPWGMAIAAASFGALSNTLLVANFGDYDDVNTGAIVAFDMKTKKAVNYVRGPDGAPLLVPGIWGMVFGNGDTLGDSNALYFASGPNDEIDGTFGSIRYTPGN